MSLGCDAKVSVSEGGFSYDFKDGVRMAIPCLS